LVRFQSLGQPNQSPGDRRHRRSQAPDQGCDSYSPAPSSLRGIKDYRSQRRTHVVAVLPTNDRLAGHGRSFFGRTCCHRSWDFCRRLLRRLFHPRYGLAASTQTALSRPAVAFGGIRPRKRVSRRPPSKRHARRKPGLENGKRQRSRALLQRLFQSHTWSPAVFVDEFDAGLSEGCLDLVSGIRSTSQWSILSLQSFYRGDRDVCGRCQLLLRPTQE